MIFSYFHFFLLEAAQDFILAKEQEIDQRKKFVKKKKIQL